MVEKVYSFAVDKVEKLNLDGYPDDEFAVVKLGFLSTAKNAHGLVITEKVLRKNADSALGRFVVAKIFLNDAMGHENNQNIFGYVPKEQKIEFTKEDESLRASCLAVISKVYAEELCDILNRDGEKSVSVEMKVTTPEDDETDVLAFRIFGITVLGQTIAPSCPNSTISFVRFSEEKANDFYNKIHSTENQLHQFAQNRRKQFMAEPKNQEELGTNVKGKEEQEKMSKEIEFAAVDIGDLWGKVFDALHDRYPDGDWCSVYRIDGIYEENGTKFAIIHRKDEDTKYRLDLTLTEDGLTLGEEITKVELEIVETEEVRKFSEPENADKYTKFEAEKKPEPEPEKKPEKEKEQEMSAEEVEAKMAQLQADIASRDQIIMEKDTELADLRKFKADVEEKEKAMAVEVTMADVKECLEDVKFSELRSEGLACTKETLDAWSNKVKAIAFSAVKKPAKKSYSGVWEISAPVATPKPSNGLWD